MGQIRARACLKERHETRKKSGTRLPGSTHLLYRIVVRTRSTIIISNLTPAETSQNMHQATPERAFFCSYSFHRGFHAHTLSIAHHSIGIGSHVVSKPIVTVVVLTQRFFMVVLAAILLFAASGRMLVILDSNTGTAVTATAIRRFRHDLMSAVD